MKAKNERLKKIRELVQNHSLSNQEDLLNLLQKNGFDITQATLSRDMKQLKIIKSPAANGIYIYTVSNGHKYPFKSSGTEESSNELIRSGFLSLDFSDKLAVIKTRPGYAMGIASDIDDRASHAILGTIAGDDTILLIPREGFDRKQIIDTLKKLKMNGRY
ncbi:MAG: arginine repressor [Candidatus Symbiothrix sp.]|jgi:transcriptional regulator of arginine metabolism|nr:arginine repressor [Candidatus Symbiothrix sp.]